MILTDVVDRIETRFQLKCKTREKNDHLLIKISGIDNCSLANWIRSEFKNVDVHVKEHEGYKFSDRGWVTLCLF
jgi:hypothetical protein